ncbi:putative disease resistance protein RGA3 [Abrus precatorius]|uniref:Disease resistance protein RGA3 n=1 Tax=Abrus precatorius TaxID=3816 RepID=A0A8B8LQ60_ABRPR|nr:putative disease resistance protein RGA3 [Abrus precatorius]XP_027358415.1 putative disease resistance protein RGA3 [Abrus precatorius]
MSKLEQIPFAVAINLVKRLASPAFCEIGQIYGVTGQLERLKQTIESINSVLLDADGKQEENEAVKEWIRHFKGAIVAADDLLDGIATEHLRLKVDDPNKIVTKVCRFFSSSNPIILRCRVAREVNEMLGSIDVVVHSPRNLMLNPRPFESETRQTSSFVIERQIVGRESTVVAILHSLSTVHPDQNVSLIAVVGMGGLGKTTVALCVYNSEKVKSLFELSIWVHVSDDFNFKTTVKKMLESITGSSSDDEESLEDLCNRLRENLNGKRYFLVLDDVWNENHGKWIQLRSLLMCGAPGSKILVTTRSRMVATVMEVETVFDLDLLTYEHSWALFTNLAFENSAEGMSPELESIRRSILAICHGVPLLIRLAAGMFRSLHQTEWKEFENDLRKQNLLGDVGDGIMSVMKLSYQKLSPQLKQCFAYCSIYPKDWEIEKNELIQLWMAQGYLEFEIEDMEEVGNQLVYTLLMKSFFEAAKFDKYGNVLSFKMHDLIHDLAQYVAGDVCCLLSEIAYPNYHPMHVSLESNVIHLVGSLDASWLRTFFLLQTNELVAVELADCLSFIFRRSCLHALNLSNTYLKELPGPINKLKHLRYLDLSFCRNLVSLPNSIGSLVNLQTLKLIGCERLEFSTKVITKLINLRYLDIRFCKAFEDMVPAGLGKLSSLQFLSTFVVGDDQKNEVGKLNELKNLNGLRGNLEIRGLGKVRDVTLESQELNLKDKKLLESLDLNWGHWNYNSSSEQLLKNLCPPQHLKELNVWWYPGVTFSDWLSSITHVSHITLFGFDKCQYLPPLELLPSLKSLEISYMKDLTCIHCKMVSLTALQFFPSLERLKFNNCENLSGWEVIDDGHTFHPHHLSLPSFPRLSELIINECQKLTFMPTFPHLLEELQLHSSTVEPLRETLGTASSSFTPLSNLKSLKIEGKILGIKDLPNQWMQSLTSLEYLEIGDVEKLDDWFVACPRSLLKIMVYDCEIQALPNEICKLQSLQHMKILGCRNLKLLPKEMHLLTSLFTLEIWDCPLLHEKCQKATGADWHKIAHIPNLILKQYEMGERY